MSGNVAYMLGMFWLIYVNLDSIPGHLWYGHRWTLLMEIVAPSSKKRLGNAKSLQIFRTTCEEAQRVSARDGGQWNPIQPCRAAGIRAERERQKPGAVVLAEARQSSLLTCTASSHVLLDCWDLLASSQFLQGQAMAGAALSPHGQRAWGIKRKVERCAAVLVEHGHVDRKS